ncbi:hypothetical protein F1880_003268 [Penicillium rolfsii]|nr:hypothetical protein F1880_003268 [Penicillium rolfsii]
MAIPSSDNPLCAGKLDVYNFVSIDFTIHTCQSHRAVCVEIILVVGQGDVADSKSVVHTEDTWTVCYLMQSFDSNEAGKFTGLEETHDIG